MIKTLNKLAANIISGGYYVCESKSHTILASHKEFSFDSNAIKDCCNNLGGARLWNGEGYSCPEEKKPELVITPNLEAGCRKPKDKKLIQEVQALAIVSGLSSSSVQ